MNRLSWICVSCSIRSWMRWKLIRYKRKLYIRVNPTNCWKCDVKLKTSSYISKLFISQPSNSSIFSMEAFGKWRVFFLFFYFKNINISRKGCFLEIILKKSFLTIFWIISIYEKKDFFKIVFVSICPKLSTFRKKT